jgi:hypothetical protein
MRTTYWAGLQQDVVADADRGHDDAEFRRALAAQEGDALQEVSALVDVHQRDQRVPDFQLHLVHGQVVLHPVFFGRLGRGLLGGLGGGDGLVPQGLALSVGDRGGRRRQDEERKVRQAGHQRQTAHDPRRNVEGHRGLGELPRDLRSQVGLGGRARYDDARRGGDHQGRDLRHQAVADGELGEGPQALQGAHVQHGHAHHEAAQDVDRGDDQAGHRVAPHELARAVHGPEEIGLAGDVGAALLGLGLVDDARVEVGVHRHLLSGHGVQGEPRGDLGDAGGPLGDDLEVDHQQDDEDDGSHDDVPAGHEGAEGVDHLAPDPLGEDQARDRDVQGELEEGDHQQDAGEDAEVQDGLDEHADHQDDQRGHDHHGQQDVQEEGRYRQEHDRDHADDAHDQDLVAPLPDEPEQWIGPGAVGLVAHAPRGGGGAHGPPRWMAIASGRSRPIP